MKKLEYYVGRIFKEARINLSFLGFGDEISGIAPITDIEVALHEMIGNLIDDWFI